MVRSWACTSNEIVARLAPPPAASNAPRLLLIAGLTASGKSALALELAQSLGGEIINADSMQLYRDLPLLTACPPEAQRGEIPHHLYGFLAPDEVFSAGQWLARLHELAAAIHQRGKWGIIVGGTGLYFTSLLRGLAPVPPIPDSVRLPLRRRMAKEGAARLHEELAALDPESAARIPPTDPQRILRGLEIHAATGRSWSEWLGETHEAGSFLQAHLYGLALVPEKEWLAGRIEARVEAMLEGGAITQARDFLARHPPEEKILPLHKLAGMKSMAGFLLGDLDEATLKHGIGLETRRYAKRQRTWIRTQMADWPHVSKPNAKAIVQHLLT